MFGCGSLFLLLPIGNRRRVRLNACGSNTTTERIKMNKKLIQTTEQKLDDLIDVEIEHLTSLCSHNDYDELRQIILNQFNYKDLTEDQIKKQHQEIFDEED